MNGRMYVRTLFEEDDVLGLEAKVGVFQEEFLGFTSSRAANHDIPRDDGRTGFRPVLFLGNSLQTSNTLGLVLEQGFMGRQSDIIASFWGTATQPGTLTTCHQEHADLTARNGM